MDELEPSAAGLYVHVPFCTRACPYCDFDFEVGALDQIPAYLQQIAEESQHYAQAGWDGFDTIYLGGGTPSVLDALQFSALFDAISTLAVPAEMREVTVEINPEHWSVELGTTLRGLGVTRVSLGVQSLDPGALKMLGRAHRSDRVQQVIAQAHAAQLAVSVDVMVGWPGQTQFQLQRDLEILVELEVAHLSVYALTVEPASAWPSLVRRGQRALPCPDAQADRLTQVQTHLEGAGYQHYEIASYARQGALARHNAKYWSAQDYLGLGPSGHSARYAADGSVQRWGHVRGLRAWLQRSPQAESSECLIGQDSAAEALWLGLRRLDGMSVRRFLQRFASVDRPWLMARTESLRARGVLTLNGDELKVAPGAWLLHDSIAQALL